MWGIIEWLLKCFPWSILGKVMLLYWCSYILVMRPGGFRLALKRVHIWSGIPISLSHVVMTEAKESIEGVGPNTDDRVGLGREPGCLCLPFHPTNKWEGLVVLWAGPQTGALWAAEQTPQFPQNHWYEGKDRDRGDERQKSGREGSKLRKEQCSGQQKTPAASGRDRG